MHAKRLLILGLFFLPFAVASASTEPSLARLLRQPDIHGDRVVFTYAGDLWLASTSGGMARRLTSHPGLEQFPKFSPDGRWIAFVGEYSGNKQVHVISVDGGQPRQLTYYNDVGTIPPRGGVDNRVTDWTPDGRYILFLPHRLPWSDRMSRHYVVPFTGGLETPLAIPEGSGGSYSPDGSRIAYTPIGREFRTWKRYRGGRAQDVWIYNLANDSSEQITNSDSTDNQPVWVGDTIYFTSDRDRTLNLFAYDTNTRQTTKVTHHDEWDVLWPSGDRSQVVYEAGGWIWRFDTRDGTNSRIPIQIFDDFAGNVARFQNVRSNIETASLSPTGARAVITARGEVFTVPGSEGEIRNLTQSEGVREMFASWSPDGRSVAYLSDRSGEYEIYIRPADGTGSERRLTTNGDIWRFAPVWSPDSSRLAFADKHAMLRWVDVASGRIHDVDQGIYDVITYYRWSPDSRWLVYTRTGETRLSTIWLHSLSDGRNHQLTSGMTSDESPVFDPAGRYLYFVSNRDFNLTFSGFEFNYLYTNPARLYVGVLAADGPALFLPTSDEETTGATPAETPATPPATPAAPASGTAAPATPTPTRIDIAGFENRVRAIPGSPGDYRSLSGVKNGVLFLAGSSLKLYNIDEKKEETVLEGVQGYSLSSNGEKVLFRSGNNYGIANARPGQKATEGLLKLDDLQMKIDPRSEYQQLFTDAWRILRDWFYDPNMHGVDWVAMREKYQPLVSWISHRSDLDYVLGEMGGELNAGHFYVQTPSDWQVPRVENALLGAEIVSDPSGFFRIAKIFPGENWHEDFRSPLTEPGVRISTGDYILAVDGVSTRGVDNFYRLLENKSNRVVTLRVGPRPELTGSREERVRPINKETNLRYLDWVQSRREMVDRLSGGRIGYIHMPNTGQEGNRELFKHFYPQAHKEALLIDVRYNGGGFIPDRMIELVERPVLSHWARRNVAPMTTPGFAHEGPKAVLINAYSSSGGDAFPYYFRQRGLGPLIGTRTWGGLIGISFNPSLMDGGQVTAPSFRFFDTEGLWAVENVGVAPDIEVVDRPELVARGEDPSLEKGVEVLLEELRRNPRRPVVVPVPPVDTP
jgi:tricorn protease